MTFLRYIASGFINFFSITQPSPENEDRAAMYIAAMLVAVLVFVIAVVTIAVRVLSR